MIVPDDTAAVTASDVTVAYGSRVIQRSLSFTIRKGDIFIIMGGSGCGKSSLLRVLMGLTPPAAGKVYYGKEDFWGAPAPAREAIMRRTGVMFQSGALWTSRTLAENVALPLVEHTRLPRKTLREAAMRTLALVGLDKFADYYPGELSGGMRKRAGLARAIVTEPPVLFCDEPTSGLDPITAAQMDQLLLDMKSCYPDMTTVVVTHDLGSVDHIAEHVLVLRSGKAAFSGTREELVASQDPYLRRFLDRKFEESRRMAAPPLDSSVRRALAEWLDD